MNIVSVIKKVLPFLLASSLLATISINVFAATKDNMTEAHQPQALENEKRHEWRTTLAIQKENVPLSLGTDINDSSFTIDPYETNYNAKIHANTTFSIVKTKNNLNKLQTTNTDIGSTTLKTTDLSSNIATIKIITGVVLFVLAIISIFSLLNLDKNKFRDYFKK